MDYSLWSIVHGINRILRTKRESHLISSVLSLLVSSLKMVEHFRIIISRKNQLFTWFFVFEVVSLNLRYVYLLKSTIVTRWFAVNAMQDFIQERWTAERKSAATLAASDQRRSWSKRGTTINSFDRFIPSFKPSTQQWKCIFYVNIPIYGIKYSHII